MSDKQQNAESDKTEMSEGGGDNGATVGAAAEKPNLLESTTSNVSTHDWLQQYFAKALGISNKPPPEKVLDDISLEGVARYIKSDRCLKICTMTGAGISTSAGIPDFRSPGSGLYDNLQKYNLPDPMAVFSLDYFLEKPEPFFDLAKELLPGAYKPTPCHYFIKMLNDKGKLMTHFTQNVDTLERVAGLPDDKVIEAHGSFHTSHCLKCKKEYSLEWMKEKILSDVIPRCTEPGCDSLIKPDIVFFGEALPKKFFDHAEDFGECDLLLIMGTSLVVQPFASMTSRVKDWCPRLYINLEKTGSGGHPLTTLMFGGGFAFDSEDNIRDVFWEGTCDDGSYALADLLGWGDELRKMVKTEHARLDKETAAQASKNKNSSKASSKKSPTASGPSKVMPVKKDDKNDVKDKNKQSSASTAKPKANKPKSTNSQESKKKSGL